MSATQVITEVSAHTYTHDCTRTSLPQTAALSYTTPAGAPSSPCLHLCARSSACRPHLASCSTAGVGSPARPLHPHTHNTQHRSPDDNNDNDTASLGVVQARHLLLTPCAIVHHSTACRPQRDCYGALLVQPASAVGMQCMDTISASPITCCAGRPAMWPGAHVQGPAPAPGCCRIRHPLLQLLLLPPGP